MGKVGWRKVGLSVISFLLELEYVYLHVFVYVPLGLSIVLNPSFCWACKLSFTESIFPSPALIVLPENTQSTEIKAGIFEGITYHNPKGKDKRNVFVSCSWSRDAKSKQTNKQKDFCICKRGGREADVCARQQNYDFFAWNSSQCLCSIWGGWVV